MPKAADDLEFNLDSLNLDFDVDLCVDTTFNTRIMAPQPISEIDEKYLSFNKAKDLADAIVIKENQRQYILVGGGFYFGDFIEAYIIKNNCNCKELTISTLSMNQNNIDSLANICNAGYVEKLNLIISHFFYSHERAVLMPYLYQELDKENRFQLAVAGTHCKIAMIETEGGKKIVIHGSVNLRSSGNLEQFVIEENKALYDFNYVYQKAIIDEYKTINKALRGEKLWHQVAKSLQE